MDSRNLLNDYIKDYYQGLSVIDDLYKIGGYELAPFLNRLYFHLNEMDRKYRPSQDLASDYHNIYDSLAKSMDGIFESFIFACDRLSQLNVKRNFSEFNFSKWNSFFSAIPCFFSVAKEFSFIGKAVLEIDKDKLRLSGDVELNDKIENARQSIYANMRKLLQEKILLTYSIENNKKEEVSGGPSNIYHLSLVADISHDENLVYLVNSGDGVLIGLSNVFEKYRINYDVAIKNGEHSVFEITNGLNLVKHRVVPEFNNLDLLRNEIIHFNFLFHPISIIIPNRGHVAPKLLCKCPAGDTGRGDLIYVKQDVQEFKKYHFKYIDIFSFFNTNTNYDNQ